MKNGIIIAGFAGIGKTTLDKKYKDIVDLDCSDYKWIYKNEIDTEKRKGIKDKIKNPKWPENYIQEILEKQKNYRIVTISLYDIYLNEQEKIQQYLEQYDIKYIACFPEKTAKQEYINRYKNRGNNIDWISGVEKNFEKWINILQEKANNKIVLKSKETLEDKLKELKYIE